MPQRQGKRHGVRTNATIRCNEFERNVNRREVIQDKIKGLSFSLSKYKHWKLLNDQEQVLPVRKRNNI